MLLAASGAFSKRISTHYHCPKRSKGNCVRGKTNKVSYCTSITAYVQTVILRFCSSGKPSKLPLPFPITPPAPINGKRSSLELICQMWSRRLCPTGCGYFHPENKQAAADKKLAKKIAEEDAAKKKQEDAKTEKARKAGEEKAREPKLVTKSKK